MNATRHSHETPKAWIPVNSQPDGGKFDHSSDDSLNGSLEGLSASSERNSPEYRDGDINRGRTADSRPNSPPPQLSVLPRTDFGRFDSMGGSFEPSLRSKFSKWVSEVPPVNYLSKTTVGKAFLKYLRFIGPGIMVSVAYMDPGNYSTAVSAGAAFQYHLLFAIFVSNIFAAFLQSLCTKLGAVTGLDLARNCREHLPRSLNLFIYILAEISIIATDLAEVVGTAIALNILFGIPYFLGVVLTIVDVLIVLMAYRPNGPMKIVRMFEGIVSVFVILTVICFSVELGSISGDLHPKEVFAGFLPSKHVVEKDGLYLSLAILGATVMPHSLYLGSGLVQPRLKEYDTKHGHRTEEECQDDSYRPTIQSIKYAMNFSIIEVIFSLFTVALFVNSAILIVAGATLYDVDGDGENEKTDLGADLYSIYKMLSLHLGKSAGVIFALALLFSGQSAGIVCTLAGQMVSEGFINWTIAPWLRRVITRAIAIVPCLGLALLSNNDEDARAGLSAALNGSQVVLSLLLPVVSAPIVMFTCSKKIMRVEEAYIQVGTENYGEDADGTGQPVMLQDWSNTEGATEDHREAGVGGTPRFRDMSNGPIVRICSVLIWGFISALNLYLIFSMAFRE